MGFAIHWHESAMGVCMSSILNPLPTSTSLPSYPSGLSQHTGFECPVSCIELGLVIYFIYGNIHFSMLFSQIIPPWVCFCTRYKVRVQLHSFACGYPVILTLPIEETSLSPLKSGLGILIENQTIIDIWVYVWTLNSIPLIYMFILCPHYTVLGTIAL